MSSERQAARRAVLPSDGFSGRLAVVTGAAGGIGRAVAEGLACRGATVAALDRDEPALSSTFATTTGITTRALDVSNPHQVEHCIAELERELGPIALLANVAGVLQFNRVEELGDEQWHECLGVNATGVFLVSRAVARRMIPRRTGAIVTVTSNASRTPRVGMAAYAASKAAAAMVTKCLGLELAPLGIRCNLVAPGSTDTAMQRLLWRDAEAPRRVIQGEPERFRLGIPLGKIASPGEVAEAVLFLLSARASHITLQELCVDGGATLGAG